ncbi:MAG: TetR/AcrR family transcriptional regulator [Halobacteriales archaeon]|nr:TetR/AcrR family transcriptional regulator [Halobacteriales archaeon]
MDDEVADEIMAATYRTLCAHGYADLTMQDIADQTDKSKALLHYHYDSKRDLLLAFLDHLFDAFTERVRNPPGETPADRLRTFVDRVLSPPEPDADAREAFGTAMLELKAQAPYDDAVRERMLDFDAFLHETVRNLLQDGLDNETFRPIDPDDTARFIVTAIEGAWTKHVAVDQDLACTRRMLRTYVDTHLLREDRDRHTESHQTDAVPE